MEKIDNVVSFSSGEQPLRSILHVDCLDYINVEARVTFDSEFINGIKVTYWTDDDSNMLERINKMFDYLFEEVLKIDENVHDDGSKAKISG